MNLPEWSATGIGLATAFTAFMQVYQTWKDKQAHKAAEERGKILESIEKQGNGAFLELKRKNMVFAQKLAEATRDAGDLAIAHEAKLSYQTALTQSKLEASLK